MASTKTLIIHPTDRSTDFLKPIYEGLYYKTVVTKGITLEQYNEELLNHERVFAMGHGSPNGLFAMGMFSNMKYDYKDYSKYRSGAICKLDVEVLKGKDNVYIWCNADEFVVENKLTGFYSGMFISEVGEAHAMGVGRKKNDKEIKKWVEQSNDVFAQLVGDVAHRPSDEIYDYVKERYGYLGKLNDVAKYNNDRLYYNDGNMEYMPKPKTEYSHYSHYPPNHKFKSYIDDVDDVDMFDRHYGY
jgi:hypothetical protein